MLRGETCLPDQEAVSAMSGPVRVSATNAKGTPRLWDVLHLVSFMASLSWVASLGPLPPPPGLATNLWPRGRLGAAPLLWGERVSEGLDGPGGAPRLRAGR
jgi:hypothetical protein